MQELVYSLAGSHWGDLEDRRYQILQGHNSANNYVKSAALPPATVDPILYSIIAEVKFPILQQS